NHHEKTVTLSAKDFRWEDEGGLVVSDEVFSVVKKITVTGLKKGERLVIETPDHYLPSADLIIPLWAGTASKTQTDALINSGIRYLDAAGSGIPVYLKIMWLEALTNAGRKELASRYFKQWYLGFAPQTIGEGAQTIIGAYRSKTGGLEQLIPLKTLLQLLGIERISDEELILASFNEFFPQVNVQYKKFKLDLESGQAKIENLNGESVLITEPGPHRIKLS
ncbi:MAG: hypothetical protein Q7U31_06950, partial [Anaerolineaceae bacterium]|nr:hypothetical protein [Anaerolineaceae bacterium]